MKKILVIDDDNAIRQTTVSALRKSGFEVLEATDGQKGLELAVRQLPDLILSDIMMAGMDGFGVLQSLRARPTTSAIPVVLMTGVLGEQNMRSGMELGADDFLAKPFSVQTLCQTVQTRLARQEAIQQQAKQQEALMLEILSATRDLVAIAHAPDGRLLYLNAAGRRLLNLGPQEGLKDLYFKDFQICEEGEAALRQDLVRTGTQHVWAGESVFLGRDGREIPVNKQILAHYSPDGQMAYLSVVASDVTERRQMELFLREKTAFFEALVNSSPDGILVVSDRGEKIVQSEQFNALLKIPRAIAENPDDTVQLQYVADSTKHPDQFRNRVLELYAQPEQTSRDEIEFKDGRILDRNTAPVLDRNGKYCGRIWSFRDITERRRAEEKLRLQTSALEAADHGILITDRDAKILWSNAAFTRLTGFSAAEVVGKTPAIQKSNRQDRQFYVQLWQTILAGEVWRGELVNCRKNGTKYFEEMTITPVCDGDGEIRHFIAVKQDVSHRKQDEAELRSSEHSFRTLADNVPDAVARFDRNLRFVYGNRTLEQGLGMPASAFLGRKNEELNLPAQAEWNAALHRVFETGKPARIEFEAPGPEAPRFLEARLVPETNSAGEVEFVLTVTRDVTEQKKAERDRQAMELQLRQSQKLEAIGQLAAGIAHEINTPTQYVGDNTRFLKDAFDSLLNLLNNHGKLLTAARENALTPEIVQHAEDVLKSSDLDYLIEQIPQAIQETLEGVGRVTKIVRAMKDFSHPGGKEKTAADLNKAIESTTTVARNEWKYVSDLKLDLDPDLPLVPCFVGEFNQVILNLVVNAAHAIGDVVQQQPGAKGAIVVQTRREGDVVVVRVSDTGTGIPEANRQHIFEPFFTTKAAGKGSGQGLALVYNCIVKQHGGRVSFETEAGKGTSFIIRLPINPPTATMHKPSLPPAETMSHL